MRDGNNALSCQRIKHVEDLAKAENDLIARATSTRNLSSARRPNFR